MKNKKMNAVIVIPTYNESGTIVEMIDYLFKNTFKKIIDFEMKVLIVDGNSPDNTAFLIKKKMKLYKNLFLIVEEKKEGIGKAYVKGFKYAVDKLKADVLIEFDGDFQHPPDAIIDLLNNINSGYDYVLGSRKIKGGGYPKNWGFKRNFFSRIGGLLARVLLFFPFGEFFKITDPTTGLKATRVKGFYEKLDIDNLKNSSFGYKIELLKKMTTLGAKIKEIPLKFQIREFGKSKIESDTPKEIFKTIIDLRLNDKKTIRFIKFGIVGFTGYLVNAFFTELFFRLSITQSLASHFINFKDSWGLNILSSRSAWASGIGIEISIIGNYILNNLWTFSSHRISKTGRFFLKMLQFNFTSIGAVVLEFLCVGIITLLFGDTILIRQIAIILSIAFLIIPYNWFMYNKVIWKKKKKENDND